MVTAAAALFLAPPWRPAPVEEGAGDAAFSNPLDLGAVLFFGALIAAILVLTKAFDAYFGAAGAVVLAAIAGLADVDSVTLSMTQLPSAEADEAAWAILVALAVNSLSKSVLAVSVGGWRFGRLYVAATTAALVVGALAMLVVRPLLAG